MNLGLNKISFGSSNTQAHRDFEARQTKRHARNQKINEMKRDCGMRSEEEYERKKEDNDRCFNRFA